MLARALGIAIVVLLAFAGWQQVRIAKLKTEAAEFRASIALEQVEAGKARAEAEFFAGKMAVEAQWRDRLAARYDTLAAESARQMKTHANRPRPVTAPELRRSMLRSIGK